MKPTPELRFVERTVALGPFYVTNNERGEMVPATRTYRVLQQKWEKVEFIHDMNRVTASEWRDVPLEKET
jgi:hypothetical protein